MSSQLASTQTQKPNKPTLIKGVEQVALIHYIQKTNWYTHGKHAETATLRTLFGLVFWDIIFDSSVPNVFVDRFQTAPLDLQTDFFYQSRKEIIDAKLDLLQNAPIDFICELISQTWNLYKYKLFKSDFIMFVFIFVNFLLTLKEILNVRWLVGVYSIA